MVWAKWMGKEMAVVNVRKKENRLLQKISTFFIGIIIALLFLAAVSFMIFKILLFDPVIIEVEIDRTCTVKVRAERFYDMSIPLYLEIERLRKKDLMSATFTTIFSNDFSKKKHDLQWSREGDLFFVFCKNKPSEILSFVDFAEGLIYPPIGDKDGSYWDKVHETFGLYKAKTGDDSLSFDRDYREGKVLYNERINDDFTLSIEAYTDWKKGVPVFLALIEKGVRVRQSDLFHNISRQQLKYSKHELQWEVIDGVVAIWLKSDNRCVLSLIDLSNKLVYPSGLSRSKDYYLKIENAFMRFKEAKGNIELSLKSKWSHEKWHHIMNCE